jgi:TonB family protein
MPYSRGNTPLPEIAGGGKPLPPSPPAVAPNPPPGGASASASEPPPPTPKKDEGLHLNDVSPETGDGHDARQRLQVSTPGEAIQQSLQAAARGRNNGPPGPGEGMAQFQNFHPNFSTEAPMILSDTMGVDFGPYLARVVYIVRRNWYSVIPESARLGEKGRVAIIFEIVKDGSVPELRLVRSSGSDALDRAAVAGIHASAPFPPLPAEFTGNHLVLQFIFLYNLFAP